MFLASGGEEFEDFFDLGLEADEAAVVADGDVRGGDDFGEAPAGLPAVAFRDIRMTGAVVHPSAFQRAFMPGFFGGDDGDDEAVRGERRFEVRDLLRVPGAVDDDEGEASEFLEGVRGAACPDVFALGFSHVVGDFTDGLAGEWFALSSGFFPDEVTHAYDRVSFGFGHIDRDGFAGERHPGEHDDFHAVVPLGERVSAGVVIWTSCLNHSPTSTCNSI